MEWKCMRRPVLFAALLFCALSLFAQKAGRGGQTLLEPGHWIYDSLQILEQESAIVQFSDRAPLSLSQVRAMMGEFDCDSLSEAGKIQYDRIIDFFKESAFCANASIFQARIEPAVNLEGYAKTNSSVGWIYDRFDKKHFLELPVTLAAGDYVALYADIFAGINKTASEDSDTFINIPYNERNFDVNFPHKAYGSFGYEWTDTVGINLRVSNMSESFGRAETGSIIQSEYLADATAAAVSIYSPIFQYTGSLTQYNSRRYLYAHKFDARIGKKVQLSLMEAALPYGEMDLRFFNPMMFLHGYASWLDYQADGSDVGSYIGLKVNVNAARYVRFFALWSMTQFQLPVELDDNDTNKDNYVPNAMGVQTGVESYVPFKKGHFHFNLEGYYAQPYLYINSSPNWSFVKASSESNSGSADFYEWIGTRYGPDTVAASFKAEYAVPEKWSAGFKYVFLARGELSDPGIFSRIGWGPRVFDLSDGALGGWVYPYTTASSGQTHFSEKYKNGRNMAAPSGTPEYVHALSLYASYCPLSWLMLTAQPSLAVVLNAGHQSSNTEISFECVFGAQVKFTKIKKNKKVLEEKIQNEGHAEQDE